MPMKMPPASSIPETPSEPRLSTLPKPQGYVSVGGRRLKETVARVRMSDARSVMECQPSAIMACEWKR